MKTKLQADLRAAMKAQDKIRVDTIRLLLSALQYEEMQSKIEPLPEELAFSVLQRELARRKEEVEFAEQAKRHDLKGKLATEIAILESFLPAQLGSNELEQIIVDLKGAQPNLNMSAAMKTLKEKFAGRYDGKAASEIAKRILG